MKRFLIAALLLTGCGYRMGQPVTQISVPYVKGDPSGRLTDYLVRELEMRGRLDYTSHAAYALHANVIRDDSERIGYRYDRSGTGNNRLNRLVPTEGKRIMEIEVKLVNEETGEVIYGPETVTASVDFDNANFDTISDLGVGPFAAPTTSTLSLSLGQLDTVEGAQIAAYDPLYQKLALLIAEGLP